MRQKLKNDKNNDLDLELIANFNINKTFEDAYNESIKHEVKEVLYLGWNVLSFEDLITSKIKANRPKDLLDIMELKEINKNIPPYQRG